MKYKIYILLAIVLNLLLIGGITYAAFMDKGSILGTTFSVGNSDIKILSEITEGTIESNLVDEIQGPIFENITPYWSENYYLKILNKATSTLKITSNADYETVNDPEDLRNIIYIEPFEWKDSNGNGLVEDGEIGTSYGRKTLVKWKTEGIELGTVDRNEVKSLILKFSTDNVSDTKQGTSGRFNFEFNAIQINP